MVEIPFVRDLQFSYGQTVQVASNIRRLVLPNPGPFTFHGTGVYSIGTSHVAVIDPGPADPSFTDAILAGLQGARVEAILVTHTHRDHSPGARPLSAATGAPIYGFGPHGGNDAEASAEEGADLDFIPDISLKDGEVVQGTGWRAEAVHTPGHTSNHLCYAFPDEGALFSGDHVMGWSTTVVSPPDGDMRAYMQSLERLALRPEKQFWPTHGPPIPNPPEFVNALLQHRQAREDQIRDCLTHGILDIPSMVERLYTDIPDGVRVAAARSVLSHLIKLVEEGKVACDTQTPNVASTYRAR